MTTTQTTQNPAHIYGTRADGTPVLAGSLEHQILVRDQRAARARAAADWAKLLATDTRAAAKAFVAATDYDRAKFIQELEMAEILSFAKGAKAELREAIIAASACGPQLRIELIPDDQLPVTVCVRRGSPLAPAPQATDSAHCDSAIAAKLASVGISVRQIRAAFSATGPSTNVRPGWNPAGSVLDGTGYELHPRERWTAMVEADPALAAQVASGALVVRPMPPSYARSKMLERRGAV